MTGRHQTEDFLRSLPQTDAWLEHNLRRLNALIDQVRNRYQDKRLDTLQDEIDRLIDTDIDPHNAFIHLRNMLSEWGIIDTPTAPDVEEYVPPWDDQLGNGVEIELANSQMTENIEELLTPESIPTWSVDTISENSARWSEQTWSETPTSLESLQQSFQSISPDRMQIPSAPQDFASTASVENILEKAERYFRETPANYIAALNILDIPNPETTFTPEDLTRYTTLKQQILRERSEVVETQINRITQIWEDDLKSLEDIRKVLVELLNNERLLFPGEYPDLRDLLASLEASTWDDRKAERFMKYIEATKSKHRRDSLKNEAWANWLKDAQSLLESALRPSSKLAQKYRDAFKQTLDRIREERSTVERLNYLVSSRSLTKNYCELAQLQR